MSFIHKTQLLAICMVLTAPIIMGSQRLPIASVEKDRFVLVSLPDRKPIANLHLIIFVGATIRDTRKHLTRIEANSDAQGVVEFEFGPKMRWIQVWHQVGKACPGMRADMVSHSNVLFDEGALVSDACAPLVQRLQPYSLDLLQPVHMPETFQTPAKPNL
jgi:hypothetical protein